MKDAATEQFLEGVVKTTGKGTVIRGLTRQAIRLAVDAYCFYERTGIMALEGFAARAIGFYVKKVPGGFDPDNPKSMKALLELIEKDAENWQPSGPPARQQAAIDPNFVKASGKMLTILQKNHWELNIDALAAFFKIESETDLNLDEIKNQIRAFAHANPKVLSIGLGGAPKVVALQDRKGEATGMKPFAGRGAGGGAKGGKLVQRFTSRVKDLGFTDKRQFERALSDMGGAATLQQLADWIHSK